MKNFIITFLIVCTTGKLYAQKRFDVFYVAGNFNFMQPTPLIPSKNYEKALLANLSLPVVLKDSSVWISILDYQSYSIKNEYLPTDTTPIVQFNLHGFILRTGYVHKFNTNQSLQVLFVPRLMTDFHANFSKSIQLGFMITYEKIKSKDLTWRAGILYNQEFFGPYITPVLYLDWNITRKLKFTGLLPLYGKLYVQPSAKISTGLNFTGLTTSYRINENGYENYYVERKSIDLSLFANVQVWKDFFIEGRAGYSLTKDYTLYAENQKVDLVFPLFYIGDNRVRANNTYNGSPFVQLRMLYSLPVK